MFIEITENAFSEAEEFFDKVGPHPVIIKGDGFYLIKKEIFGVDGGGASYDHLQSLMRSGRITYSILVHEDKLPEDNEEAESEFMNRYWWFVDEEVAKEFREINNKNLSSFLRKEDEYASR